MSFPEPGDTNVRGFVIWFNSKVQCGQVEAYASMYGTPDATAHPYDDPLRFEFSSPGESFGPNQQVLFDIGEGPQATNVRAA